MNHAEIVQLREAATNFHGWDFIFSSDGDTIKEKLESLQSIVRTLCLRKKGSDKEAVVVAHDDLALMLTPYDLDDNAEWKDEDINDIHYVGRFPHDCGDNGYHTEFLLYSDSQFAKDEILVSLGDKVSVIKLFCSPF